MTGRAPSRFRALLAFAALLIALPQVGCVHRRMMVRSNPPGALVYVDNQEVGSTPVSVPFIYYGTREIKVVKSGYETIKDRVRLNPPWYEYPGAEFVSENLVPWDINDNRYLSYNLQPKLVTPTKDLLQRGEQLRQSSHAPAPVPPGAPALQPPGDTSPYELPLP